MYVCPECGAAQPTEGRCLVDGSLAAAVGEDLLLGTTIGAYRVARLLGIGGMGRVYKGVHPTIGSRVAIKVLSRECSDRRDLVERFFAEAKAVNLIRHESIVNVLDLAMLPDGRPYIIMEYLDGAPLASIIEHAVQSQQPLPLGGMARLAVEVLDALAAAHAKGIVHRDLKPDNIFVTPSGRPKVLDFGIAKLNDAASGSATRTGSLLGTPHYMSPEQAAGKPVDHRADVYAIGVILFECATGQRPFSADSLFDLLRQHVEVPPPSPRALRRELAPELESVILTALAKLPEQRFSSAYAMSMALQHATAHLTAEQWTPITGGGTHRSVPSGGWQPTPPASWGGSGAITRDPRASNQPSPQNPALGGQSTVSASAGQVERAAPSRKGRWLAFAGLAAVAGVITAAVAGGSDGGRSTNDTSEPVATAASEPTAPIDGAAAAGSATVASAGGSAAPVTATAPATPTAPATAPTPPARPAAGADDDRDDDDTGDLGDTSKMLDEAIAALDGIDLAPEVKRQLAELKDLGKLSPQQRMERIKQIQQQLAEDPSDPAPSPPAKPTTPTAPATGGWITARDLSPPPGFNPKRVDVAAAIRYALAEAKRADPDAVLFRIDVDGVGPDGTANLELPSHASDHGSLDLRFFSPRRAVRDPKVPLGVPVKHSCEFRIEVSPDGVGIRPINGFDCSRNVAVPAPRCSAAALWKRAIAKRAPTNAVASLGYRAPTSGAARWYFDIGSGFDKVFSSAFDDGC